MLRVCLTQSDSQYTYRMLTKAYAAASAGAQLEPIEIERRELRPHDVLIDIKYAGVCHSDIH